MASINTRANLKPADEAVPYNITTSDVENYLKEKFAAVAAGMGTRAPDMTVYTTNKMGRKFKPFVVIFDTSILDDGNNDNKNKTNRNQKELPMFHPQEESRTSTLIKAPYYVTLKTYMFDEDDRNRTFRSDTWRHQLGVSRDAANRLRQMSRPTISRHNNGSVSIVAVIIDPIRVFFDMLYDDTDKRHFDIFVDSTVAISKTACQYNVLREVSRNKKKNDKFSDEFIYELERKIGSNR